MTSWNILRFDRFFFGIWQSRRKPLMAVVVFCSPVFMVSQTVCYILDTLPSQDNLFLTSCGHKKPCCKNMQICQQGNLPARTQKPSKDLVQNCSKSFAFEALRPDRCETFPQQSPSWPWGSEVWKHWKKIFGIFRRNSLMKFKKYHILLKPFWDKHPLSIFFWPRSCKTRKPSQKFARQRNAEKFKSFRV